MGENSKSIAKLGLALTLIVVGLNSICLADVPRRVEQYALAQKWEKVSGAFSTAELTADPVARLLNAYACLVTFNYRWSVEQFSFLGSASDVEKLADYASALAQRHPQNAVAQMLQGDALARSGKYDEALSALDKAVRLDPQSALLYDVRGVVHALVGKTEEAIADFEKAIELDPRLAEASVNRGIVRFWRGEVDGAMADFNKSIELAPEFALAYNSRGQLAFSIEEWEAAIADFEAAGRLVPGVGWIQSNIRLAQSAKAKADLSRQIMVMGSRGTTLSAQTLLIDGAGVESRGAAPRQAWARELLGPEYVQINIRHEGAPLWLGSKWPAGEQNIITLPHQWNAAIADQELKPLLQKAQAEGKSVYVNIDANLTLPGYLAGAKTNELKWAAQIADYVLQQTPKEVHKVFSGHSAFTDVPQYMSEKSAIKNWILQSPRNFSHMETLVRSSPSAHFDLVTGEGDAPHWGPNLHQLKGSSVRVIELLKPGLGTPLDWTNVHSKVGQPFTRGEFKITTSEGTVTKQGRLGGLVSHPLNQVRPQFVSLREISIPNYWVTPETPLPAATALVSMVNTGSRMPLSNEPSPLPRHALVAGTGPHAERMIRDFRDAGWKVTSMSAFRNLNEVEVFASRVGATRITGVTSGRGGIYIPAEVDHKDPNDKYAGDMPGLGGRSSERGETTDVGQEGLFCPFLLFCASSARK